MKQPIDWNNKFYKQYDTLAERVRVLGVWFDRNENGIRHCENVIKGVRKKIDKLIEDREVMIKEMAKLVEEYNET